MSPTPNSVLRLRKHADYQRVYASSRKQFAKQMSFFYSLRPAGASIRDCGTTDWSHCRQGDGEGGGRNRIKRRMRECIRRSAGLIHAPVDVILHPRKVVIDLEFAKLEREVAQVFRSIQAALDKQLAEGAAGDRCRRASSDEGFSARVCVWGLSPRCVACIA